jgi:hypothetical protein
MQATTNCNDSMSLHSLESAFDGWMAGAGLIPYSGRASEEVVDKRPGPR